MPGLGSAYARNVLKLFYGTSLKNLITFLALPVLTRLYSPEDIGLFQLLPQPPHPRRKRFRRGLEAVEQQPAPAFQVSAKQGLHERRQGAGAPCRPTGPVDRGRGQPCRRANDHEVQQPQTGNRLDLFSPAAADRRTADKKQGHVASQLRAQSP